jgi:hypothetical protein
MYLLQIINDGYLALTFFEGKTLTTSTGVLEAVAGKDYGNEEHSRDWWSGFYRILARG